jgi:hypothetical protein
MRTFVTTATAGMALTLVACSGSSGLPPLVSGDLELVDDGGALVRAHMSAPTASEGVQGTRFAYELALDGARYRATVEVDAQTGAGTASFATEAHTVQLIAHERELGVEVEFVDKDVHGDYSVVAVVPKDVFGNSSSYQWLLDPATPALASARPLDRRFLVAMETLRRIDDARVNRLRAALLLATYQYLDDLRADHASAATLASLARPSAANAMAEDCQGDSAQSTSAPYGGASGDFKVDDTTFSFSAYGIKNDVRSACPSGETPVPRTFGDGKARFVANLKPPVGGACSQLGFIAEGKMMSVIDNRQEDGPGCKEDGTNDTGSLIWVHLDVPVLPTTTQTYKDIDAGDLGCNQAQCVGFSGKVWACISIEKVGGWLWKPDFSVGTRFEKYLGRDRDTCDRMTKGTWP